MNPYILPLEELYQLNANADFAAQMKKYMRNQFELFGIKTPLFREINKGFLKKYGLPPRENLEEIIKELWNLSQREYQHFGMELLKKFIKKADKKDIDLLEWIIIHKSWWDTIDYIASNLVAPFFRQFPHLIKSHTEKWIATGNIWLQRTCILFQLKYKAETDTGLLFRYVRQLNTSKEFFIQKAIGWALREYAKTNPEAVKDFVANTELASLSKREALRRLK